MLPTYSRTNRSVALHSVVPRMVVRQQKVSAVKALRLFTYKVCGSQHARSYKPIATGFKTPESCQVQTI